MASVEAATIVFRVVNILFFRWLILAIAVVVSAAITHSLGFDFQTDVSSFGAIIQLLVGVALLAVINLTLGNLLKLITLPLNCMTLGLMSLVINAAMLLIAGNLHFGIHVGSFMAAFFGSIFISLVNGLLVTVFHPRKKRDD